MAEAGKTKAPPKSTIGIIGFYKFMLRYQRRYPLLLALLGLCIVMRVTYEIVFPIISEWLFNSVLYSNDFALFLFAMKMLGVTFLCSMLGNLLQAMLTPKITYKVVTLLRLKLFGKIQRISQATESDASTLSTYFVSDLTNITNASQYYMWGGITNLAMACIGTIVLFWFDWKMSLMVAVLFPLTMVVSNRLSKRNRQLFTDKYELEGKLLEKVQESIKMQDILRIFLLKILKRKAFRSDLLSAAETGQAYGTTVELTYRSVGLGILLIQFLVIFAGGFFVMKGQLTPGRLVGFYFLLSNVSSAINALMGLYPNLNNCVGSLEKMMDFLHKKTFPAIPPKSSAPKLADKIKFNKIQLTTDGHHILDDINLELPKGKSIAFVGASGSGKSTLLKLILKEITPSEGEIYLDKIEYKDIITNSLLAQVGVVMQQPKLFLTTIAENIRMGKLAATPDEIVDAAKKAGLHEDIMQLPNQYESVIGLGSVQLSGGQAQRLTIARALIANPDILCLDEVTSALDPISGAAIEELLNTMVLDHTIISITHRLSSVVKADLIVVLDKGKVVEKGTHKELLAQGGLYAQLWDKQQGFVYNDATKGTQVIPQWLTLVPLFTSLSPKFLNELSQEFVMERADADQIVFNENDHGEKFYILVAGIVEIVTHRDGEEVILAKLTDGDFFGEVALLFDTPRNATVRSKGVSIFLTLHYHKFQQVFQKLPEEQKAAIIEIAKNRLSQKQKKFLNIKEE